MPERISAATKAEDAMRALLSAAAQDFALQLSLLMVTSDPEGPHKARVALRKMRTYLAAFAPILAKSWHHELSGRLCGYFRTLAVVRDADVLAHDLDHPELVDKADLLRRKVRKSLARHSASRLSRDIARDFSGRRWHHKGSRDLRQGSVSRLAAAALARAWDRSLAHGADLRRLEPPERHRLRKSLKTLRYLAEAFAPLWPGPEHDAFLATLRPLQDDLGLLNDAAMAEARGIAPVGLAGILERAQGLWAGLQATPVRLGKAK